MILMNKLEHSAALGFTVRSKSKGMSVRIALIVRHRMLIDLLGILLRKF